MFLLFLVNIKFSRPQYVTVYSVLMKSNKSDARITVFTMAYIGFDHNTPGHFFVEECQDFNGGVNPHRGS